MSLTKEEAIKQGSELLSIIEGEGWSLEVFENLGWHFCICNGPLTVFKDRKGEYSCFVGEPNTNAGCGIWDIGHHKNPNKAVRIAIKKAEEALKYYQDIVDGAREIFPENK